MTTDPGILVGGNTRMFIQDQGINPGAAYNYYGCTQMDGPSQELSKPDPVYCPSPTKRNQWNIIDDIAKTPALGAVDFLQHAARDLSDIWFDIKDRGCKFNFQVVAGTCQRPDQFDQWDAKIIFLGGRLNSLKMGMMNPLSGDTNAAVDISGTLSFIDWKIIRPIRFTERADSTVVAEVLDGFYYDTAQCGDCGTPSDGCNVAYVLTAANSGSPGLSSQIAYSLDKGKTWATVDIPTLGGLSGSAAGAMGSYILVISQAAGNYQYSPISSVNAGTVNWTAVSSGFVSTKGPRALWVKSSSAAYIAAAGGYIYFLSGPTVTPTVLTDGSVTSQQLNAIHGSGLVVVAVGNSNALLASSNGGSTFSLITGPAVGVNLTSVWVASAKTWFVGTGNGKLYYTLDGGSTWTQIGLGVTASVIDDIFFENDVVGYLATEVAGAALVLRTTDGGNTWQSTSPSISSLPAAVRCNFVASCGVNRVLTGGRKTVGGDGLVAIAE